MRKKVETPVTSRHHVTGGGGRGVRDQGLVPNHPFRPLLEALGVLTWSAPRRGIQRSRCAPLRYGGERLLMLGGEARRFPCRGGGLIRRLVAASASPVVRPPMKFVDR